MKKLITMLLTTLPLIGIASSEPKLFEQKVKSLKNAEINLKSYKGKPLLFVNIATRCGYTGQLGGLETLYKKYKDKGLVIIGIPSNNFGSQTPEENKEIGKFCRLKYGVSFPITSKVVVTGSKKHPLVRYLVKASGGKEIGWNFEKFLFDKNGRFVSRFLSSVSPEDSKLKQSIEKTLN
ncbi:MAG: glutathione peroxidase-family protein [Thermoproteota archaeon]|jgi:glutathione peroxidase-family protein